LKNYIHYFIHREQRDTTIETEIQVTNLLLFIFYFFSTIETGIGYYTFLVFITDSVDLMLNFFFIITMLAYTFHTNNTNALNQSKPPSVLVLIPLSLEVKAEMCSICLNTESAESKMYKLECEHVFHMKCIKDWYIVKQSCPNCRKIL
jgi:hypothetical protein